MRILEYINLNESIHDITSISNDIYNLSDGDFKNAYNILYNWLSNAKSKDGKLRLIDCITGYKIINRPDNYIEITGSNNCSYYIGVEEDKDGIKFWCTTRPAVPEGNRSKGTGYTEIKIPNSKAKYDTAKEAVKSISNNIL